MRNLFSKTAVIAAILSAAFAQGALAAEVEVTGINDGAATVEPSEVLDGDHLLIHTNNNATVNIGSLDGGVAIEDFAGDRQDGIEVRDNTGNLTLNIAEPTTVYVGHSAVTQVGDDIALINNGSLIGGVYGVNNTTNPGGRNTITNNAGGLIEARGNLNWLFTQPAAIHSGKSNVFGAPDSGPLDIINNGGIIRNTNDKWYPPQSDDLDTPDIDESLIKDIQNPVAIHVESGDLTFTNENGGEVYGDIITADGDDTLYLWTGTILDGDVDLGTGTNEVYLRGSGQGDLAPQGVLDGDFTNITEVAVGDLDGGGTWDINGNWTVDDKVEIISGRLNVNGVLTTPETVVKTDAALGIDGTLHGDVDMEDTSLLEVTTNGVLNGKVEAGNEAIITIDGILTTQGDDDDGIKAGDDAIISMNGGTITAGSDAIDVGDRAIINIIGGSTLTAGDEGIEADDGATITVNGSTITAGGDGIRVGHSLYLEEDNADGGKAGDVSIRAEIDLTDTTIEALSGDGIAAKDDVTITMNGSSIEASGDGIYVYDRAEINLINTTIDAGDGIAAEDDATITMNGSSIKAGTDGIPDEGDGISVWDRAEIDLTDTTIEAVDDGIYAEEDVTITMKGSSIEAGGNGIFADDGATITMNGSSIKAGGDGMYVYDRAEIDLTDTTIIAGGAGVYAEDGATITMNGSTITAGGDGIYVEDSLYVEELTADGVEELTTDGGEVRTVSLRTAIDLTDTIIDAGGDGIYAEDDVTITITGSTITAGDAGISATVGAKITITGTTITADDGATLTPTTITAGGDGIYAGDGAKIALTDTTINAGTDGIPDEGDGVFANNDAIITMTRTTITAVDDGIYAGDGATITLLDTLITADDDGIEAGVDANITITGGGITAVAPADYIEDPDEYFDGINTEDDANIRITGSTITADDDGIYTLDAAIIDLTDTIIEAGGDGIYAEDGATITMNGSTITAGGDGIYVEDSLYLEEDIADGGEEDIADGVEEETPDGFEEDTADGDEVGDVSLRTTIALTDTTIEAGDDGIYAEDDARINLVNTTITADDDGIQAFENAIIAISGGTIDAGTDGIYTKNAALISMNSSTIIAGGDGIFTLDDTKITITGRTFTAGDDTTITGTTITAGDDGIYAKDDANITITGTTITAGDDGISVEDDAEITITDTTITAGNVGIKGGNHNTIYVSETSSVTGENSDGIQLGDGLYAGNTDIHLVNPVYWRQSVLIEGTVIGRGFDPDALFDNGGDGVFVNDENLVTVAATGHVEGDDEGLQGRSHNLFIVKGTVIGHDKGVFLGDYETYQQSVLDNEEDSTLEVLSTSDGIVGHDNILIITETGSVHGDTTGIRTLGTGHEIINAGRITAGNDLAIQTQGNVLIDNAGYIGWNTTPDDPEAIAPETWTAAITNDDGEIVIINRNGGVIDGDINTGGGDDELHLETGSTIVGNVDLGQDLLYTPIEDDPLTEDIDESLADPTVTDTGIDKVFLFGEGQGVLDANIAEAELLEKHSAGTWDINGDVTVDGVSYTIVDPSDGSEILIRNATSLFEGRLNVNGSLNSDVVVVSSGAVLGGNGVINGDVGMSGLITPGTDSVDTLTINGEVIFFPNQTNVESETASVMSFMSSYDADIVDDGTNDLILVSDTASLDGHLNVQVGDDLYVNGHAYDVLIAANGVEGTFATLGFNGGENDGAGVFKGYVEYQPDRVRLLSVKDITADLGNQTGFGDILGGLGEYGLHESNKFGAFLSQDDDVTGTLARLSGEFYNAYNEIGLHRAHGLMEQGTERLLHARQGHADGQTVSSGPSTNASVGSSGDERNVAIWATGQFSDSTVHGKDGFMEYDFNSTSVSVGVDVNLGDNAIAGIMGSIGGTDVSYHASELHDGDVKDWALGGYLGYFLDSGFYTTAGVGYLDMSMKTTRDATFLDMGGLATADYDGSVFYLYGNIGYQVDLDSGLTVTPEFSVAYSQVKQDMIDETGSGEMALAIEAQSHKSVRGIALIRLAKSFKSDSRIITPHASVGYAADFKDDERVLDTIWMATGDHFNSFGEGNHKSSFIAGAGVSMEMGSRLTLDVDYSGEFAGTHVSHTGQVNIRLSF